MSPRLIPLAAGLIAAAVAFAGVALATDRGGDPGPSASGASQAGGRAVFIRMGCGSCHHLAAASSTGAIGPDLDSRLSDHTARSLEAQITAPGPTSVMPSDFAARMSASELNALVEFLLATAG